MSKNKLVGNFSADGNSSELDWGGRFVGHISAYGTFGSGTVTLQYSLDAGATWNAVDTTNLAFTADGNGNFELPFCKLRINLAGSTTPDIDYVIDSVSAISQK